MVLRFGDMCCDLNYFKLSGHFQVFREIRFANVSAINKPKHSRDLLCLFFPVLSVSTFLIFSLSGEFASKHSQSPCSQTENKTFLYCFQLSHQSLFSGEWPCKLLCFLLFQKPQTCAWKQASSQCPQPPFQSRKREVCFKLASLLIFSRTQSPSNFSSVFCELGTDAVCTRKSGTVSPSHGNCVLKASKLWCVPHMAVDVHWVFHSS